jgi:hypothetical protein
VYRVVELSEGWTGHLIKQQWLFVGLEGVMVVIAVAVLNAFHPAFCFGAKFEEGKVLEGKTGTWVGFFKWGGKGEEKGLESENSV